VLLGGIITPSGETVNVTVVDSIDNSVVASTTVPLGADITSWLNSLTVPTHEGYKFSGWEITAGYITSVNDNATVYIKYTEDSGGGKDETTVQTYVNGDGDISVQISNLQDEISGQADVQVYFSKALNTVNYDKNRFDVFEFGSGMGAKTDIKTDSNIVSFTDEDCSTHDFYRFGFCDESGNRLGQSLWDGGLYITRIKFSLSDGTEKVYEATKL
jgi:hypothetical protein